MHRHRGLRGGRHGVPREARAALRPLTRARLTGTTLARDLDVVLAPNPSPFTGTGTQTYILGRGDVAVIDPGPTIPGHLDRVEAAARARGRTAVVLLTHHHADHSEAAEAMARRLDAPLAAIPHPLAPALDQHLGDGDRLEVGADTLEVLATPGHCRDHACFVWARGRAVLVGDLVAGTGFIVIDPPEGNMADYLASLARVRDLGCDDAGAAVEVLLPAHGPAVENPHAYLEGYIAHRLAREEKVFEALEVDVPRAPEALLPVAYDDTPEAMHPIAARSLQAHLEKLVADGRAEVLAGGYRRLG